ncbi:MAG: diguanylate cyclase, partial [Gammaproteobacteria bacterium]|nr:diguanylate cyclase [Gammaproteobacteria bacterium]
RVLNLYIDRSGGLWIGTDSAGLNRFNPDKRNFTRFQTFEINGSYAASGNQSQQTLTLDTPMDMVEDRDGSLWIGTFGQGLWRWNADERNQDRARVDVFRKSDGLPSSTVTGVLEEGSGALWLSSDRGLTRFDVKGRIRQFDLKNGLMDREFNQGSRLRSRSGKLMFGGISGVVSFYPGDLPVNERPPQIVVEARSRQEHLISTVSGDPVPEIEVGYPDRFLSFDFVALDFISPDKNQYRYKLEGFDDDWVEGDGFRRATYTNLAAGKYTFLVEGSNNDGLWNRNPAAINVRVFPAPWDTWWAYLIYFSLVAFVVGLYLRWHLAKLKLDVEHRDILEKKVDDRTQELAERNTQLQNLNELLAEASVTDSLTQLRNRRFLDQFVESQNASKLASKLGSQAAFSIDKHRPAQILFLMMIDLDDFKMINDTFGHQAGDEVLIQVKEVLEATTRSSDELIRWGGDEFMIIGIASSEAAAKLLGERIRAAVSELVYDAGNGVVGLLSASIGIATFGLIQDREDFGDWEQIMGIADRAAYIAKSNGRNAWVCLGGSELLDSDQLAQFSETLEAMVESGLVRVDSSLTETPILLHEQKHAALRGPGRIVLEKD